MARNAIGPEMSLVMTTSQRTMTMSPGAISSASVWASRIFSASVCGNARSRNRGYYRRSVRVNTLVTREHVPTAELADAAGVAIAMHHRIRPVWPGARVAGAAFTVRTPPGEHRAVREAADQAPPG